jgi:hypothetical protein
LNLASRTESKIIVDTSDHSRARSPESLSR